MSDEHPQFPDFKEVGHLDVDAGSIWLGDGCYVLKDKDEARPKDLGDDWHGICERFFDRSGYHDRHEEYSTWRESWRDAWYEAPEFAELRRSQPQRPDGHTFDRDRPDDQKCDYDRHFEREMELMRAFRDKYLVEHPFQPTVVDTGVAQFNHDLGHSGMGLMVSTYYGDGTYPVYVEYKDGRPRRVLIDFDPGADEEEEELLEAAE